MGQKRRGRKAGTPGLFGPAVFFLLKGSDDPVRAQPMKRWPIGLQRGRLEKGKINNNKNRKKRKEERERRNGGRKQKKRLWTSGANHLGRSQKRRFEPPFSQD